LFRRGQGDADFRKMIGLVDLGNPGAAEKVAINSTM
jgi:hypothetical protein